MAASQRLQIAGEPIELLGDRALYWPARRRLLIADLHLGKADIFRRAGIGLPAGGTTHDLERLSQLLHDNDARELWVLGDVVHGPAHHSAWHQQWMTWRRDHAATRVVAVAGNHDRALPESQLELEILSGDCVEDAPFALRHEPAPHAQLHVICGHLHPLAALPGMRRRWPAFWLREGMTILPAFSHFTAGVVAEPESGEQLVVCVEGDVVAMPVHRQST